MAKQVVFENNRVIVDAPKRTKKLTGTRLASVFGLNKWSSPFQAWCEMTKTYEQPFEDTIYTQAGKVIEPKICEFLRKKMFMQIKSPTDVYGENYFNKTWGDFYPNDDVFGGMWDFLGDDFVVEVKTTKRSEDWLNEEGKVEPPIYYKLQASLYAYLLGFNKVVMTCSFLTDKDYEAPQDFVPSLKNTVIIEFNVDDEFPNFMERFIEPAREFYYEYVKKGISPIYDEKVDAEFLKALRTNSVDTSDDEMSAILKRASAIQRELDILTLDIKPLEDELKKLKAKIKNNLAKAFRDNDTKVVATYGNYEWVLSRETSMTFDSKAFEQDHKELAMEYMKPTTKDVLRVKEIKL